MSRPLTLMLAPDGWTPEAQLPTELLAALWRAAFDEADHNEDSSMIPDEYAMWLLENEAHIVYEAQSAGLIVCTCERGQYRTRALAASTHTAISTLVRSKRPQSGQKGRAGDVRPCGPHLHSCV